MRENLCYDFTMAKIGSYTLFLLCPHIIMRSWRDAMIYWCYKHSATLQDIVCIPYRHGNVCEHFVYLKNTIWDMHMLFVVLLMTHEPSSVNLVSCTLAMLSIHRYLSHCPSCCDWHLKLKPEKTRVKEQYRYLSSTVAKVQIVRYKSHGYHFCGTVALLQHWPFNMCL